MNESADSRVEALCNSIRKEAIEPAIKESKNILNKARAEAENILDNANKEADLLIKKARTKAADIEKKVVSELELSVRLSIEKLKGIIETKLFKPFLRAALERECVKCEFIAEATRVVIDILQREGLSANLTLIIPKKISTENLARALASQVVSQVELKQSEQFASGFRLFVRDTNLLLDFSSEALEELFWSVIRYDLRSFLF